MVEGNHRCDGRPYDNCRKTGQSSRSRSQHQSGNAKSICARVPSFPWWKRKVAKDRSARHLSSRRETSARLLQKRVHLAGKVAASKQDRSLLMQWGQNLLSSYYALLLKNLTVQ